MKIPPIPLSSEARLNWEADRLKKKYWQKKLKEQKDLSRPTEDDLPPRGSEFVGFVFFACAALLLFPATVYCATVDVDKIIHIESSGNPIAHNVHSGARGLMQITPICLKEYNNFHGTAYIPDDLFDPELNRRIGEWYITVRIPQMLRHYGVSVTVENVLISYNAGVLYAVRSRPLPLETKNYIKKYNSEKLTDQ